MSRHYHDSDCTPGALESIDEQLSYLADLIERLVEALERISPPPPDPSDKSVN